MLGPVGEDVEHLALRREVPPQRQHQAFDREDVGERAFVELDDHALLEVVDEFVELVEQREVLVDRRRP